MQTMSTQLCITLIETAGLNTARVNTFHYYSQESLVKCSLCSVLALFTLKCECVCVCGYSLSSCVCSRVGGLRGPSPGVVKQRVEPKYQVNFLRPLTNPVWREPG